MPEIIHDIEVHAVSHRAIGPLGNGMLWITMLENLLSMPIANTEFVGAVEYQIPLTRAV